MNTSVVQEKTIIVHFLFAPLLIKILSADAKLLLYYYYWSDGLYSKIIKYCLLQSLRINPWSQIEYFLSDKIFPSYVLKMLWATIWYKNHAANR